MKHRLGLAALLLGLALGACSFEKRSDAFACESASDCDGERVCIDGWCVLGGLDPEADGSRDECPDECSFCEGAVCVVLCNVQGSCDDGIECPDDRPCRVECSGLASCRGPIECSSDDDCEIFCSGTGSCNDSIECGDGACSVSCTGIGSCAEGVSCEDACRCDVSCPLGNCGASDCPSGPACVKDDQCSSQSQSCNTCD